MSRPAISYPLPSNHSSGGADAYDDMSRRSTSATGYDMPAGHQLRDGGPTTRSSSSQSSRGPTSTLDSFITRLLVVTKQLLQGLDQWSQGVLSEEDVSDIYVRLGNGFELCVAAFRRVGISTTDLDSVPRDLREILERALAEEPSQDTLNIYLPDIRAIIFNLLSGLKHKQTAYKRLQADRQQQPEVFTTTNTSGQPPSRPPRLSGAGTPEGPGSPGSISSQITSGSRAPSSAALAERNSQQRDRRAAPPDAFRPTRSRPSGDSFSKVPQDHLPNHTPSPPMQNAPPPPPTSGYVPPLPSPAPGPSRPPSRLTRSRDSFSGHGHHASRFSADSDAAVSSESATANRPVSSGPRSPVVSPGSPTPTTATSANLPTINLPADTAFPEPRPALPPAPPPVPAPPSPSTGETLHEIPEAQAAPRMLGDDPSLISRLQRSEALERRASKRFSSFTFNKMLPGSPNTKKPMNGSPQRPARRGGGQDRPPPLPALHEDNRRLSQVGSLHAVTSISSGGSSPTQEHMHEGRPVSMMGGLGITVEGPDGTAAPMEGAESVDAAPSPSPAAPKSMSVFLQLGRQVKKTTVELPLTMSALRLLFMERFEYDPGMEDFPDVYIRDNRTGVQYELEDMDDLKEGCVLTLDVEPLDQVKQHFDLTFAQLSQDIKELKSSLTASRRMSMQVPSLLGVTSSPSSLAVSPTVHVPVSPPAPRPMVTPDQPMARPLPATARSASTGSIPVSNTIDLQRHHKEVQDLRTDLAVLRQIHVDFLNSVKEQFTALRAENTAMREVVKTKMGGNRALLDNSKTKLDAQCQDTIQAVEEVSDIIDGAREDAVRRGVTPSRAKMEKIRADLTKATALVEEFASDVTLAEPTWRATWLTELQRVTEEQRLLAYQNKLATDLKNDIKDAADMLDNVDAFVQQRAAAGHAAKKFRPPSPEEGGGGISHLLLEIRTKESDPNQRLRAIEEQQRARERELASQTDEFSNELAGFVQGKRLRKTGGTEEAERVRQRRHDQTVKRMLSGDMPGETPGIISPQLTGNTNANANQG